MSLRHAALGLLAQEPGSGYDLLKRFQLSMENVWPATQSQLYGELNKLAATGLIEVTDIGPRGRKEYAITDAGRAELRRWMSSQDDDPPFRSVSLLRVFLLGELGPDEAREFLKSWQAWGEEQQEHYKHVRDAYEWPEDDDGKFFARAALEYGLRSTRVDAEWPQWVLDRMDKRGRRQPG